MYTYLFLYNIFQGIEIDPFKDMVILLANKILNFVLYFTINTVRNTYPANKIFLLIAYLQPTQKVKVN